MIVEIQIAAGCYGYFKFLNEFQNAANISICAFYRLGYAALQYTLFGFGLCVQPKPKPKKCGL